MAKKEYKRSYLQMPLPEGRKHYKMTKRAWSGLNYRQTIDTGELSMEKNISTLEAPYLTPSEMPEKWLDYSNGKVVVGLYGFDDMLLVLYRYSANYTLYVDCIKLIGDRNNNGKLEVIRQGIVKEYNVNTYIGDMQRSIVQFNVYDTLTAIDPDFVKKLIIFPDAVSMYMDCETIDELDTEMYDSMDLGMYFCEKYGQYYKIVDVYNEDTKEYDRTAKVISKKIQNKPYFMCEYIDYPPKGIKYATVHQSRVFALSDDRIFVSEYNNYANFSPDPSLTDDPNQPWIATAQANTKSDSSFTGITTFLNHVVCFQKGYMHEIYNDRNPFRIHDIFAEGAIDNRTIQDVDGTLIFVSEDGVKIYTGANPRVLDYNLNISKYKYAVSGTDGRCYYLYCETTTGNRFLVYDTICEEWSERVLPGNDNYVVNFARTSDGFYMLLSDNCIYQLDSMSHTGVEWSFETDLITNETVDIKHVKKIQMFADMEKNSEIWVYLLYDDEKFSEDDEDFKKKHLVYYGIYSGEGESRKAIRFKTRMTANYGFKVHVEGKGYTRLYEMEIAVENGGELFV